MAATEMPSAEGSTNGSHDLEAMIQEFLSDDTRTSLELPKTLTSDERKTARRLVDQHPVLKCESYGFGEERQLHVFKTAPQDRVRVKNTFIDDWEGAEGGGETPAFRSMPPTMPVALLERTLERCGGISGVAVDARALFGIKESPGLESGVPDRSPTASSETPELPPLPEGFKVRNTFIHIESVPAVERIVQSMPDGMFRQCLEEELSTQIKAQAASQTTSAGPSSTPPLAFSSAFSMPPSTPAPAVFNDPDHLLPGTEVVIEGLVKLPDFNGLTGVVQSLDPETGRYDVLLDGPAGTCGWRWVKVKRENCRTCMPPPPRDAPKLPMQEWSAR